MKFEQVNTYYVFDSRLDSPIILAATPPESFLTPETFITAIETTIENVIGDKAKSNPEPENTWRFFGQLISRIAHDIKEVTDCNDSGNVNSYTDEELLNLLQSKLDALIGHPETYKNDIPDTVVEPDVYITLIVKAYELLAVELHADTDFQPEVEYTTENPFVTLQNDDREG